MSFFKKLAKVFVDFEDEKVPETKEDVEKALKDIRNEKSPHKERKFVKVDGADDREVFLELDDVFTEKGLAPDSSPNTIYKVFDILQSPQLQGLDPKTVKTAVMLNLEMNKIPIPELVKDGQKRIIILQEYEKEKTQDILNLSNEINGKNKEIDAEINAYLEKKKLEIKSNNEKLDKIKISLEEWRKVKDEEVEGLQNLVDYLSKKNEEG
jgi:hypothetical protein